MCDCIKLVNAKLEEVGNPTRISGMISLSGAPTKCAVASYVPESYLPNGRRARREKPTHLVAAFCPFCGVAYPAVGE